ncbi:FUSC family protein [Brucella thiophenivorans]|nr:FUSC family protein [Brucella thiophenivorans]
MTDNNDPMLTLLRLNPGKWQWSRAIRSFVCIGVPFAFGYAAGDIMTGMWIAMGCLMMITGESSGSYRSIYSKIIISAPLGALGYLLGYLGSLPWSVVIVCMMLVGFASVLLSDRSRALSIGTLQTLLLASISLGVPAITSFWEPAVLYLVGAAFYAIILSIEVLIRGWHAKDDPDDVDSKYVKHATVAASLPIAFAFAVCLGAAYSFHWLNHSAHWFWVPLTVGLVMKPDFGSIRDRAVQRIIGTLGGVFIGALALAFIPKGLPLILTMSLLAGILPWAMQRSYVLQAVFLTPLILMLVDIISPGTHDMNYGMQRLIDTGIGGIIVILFGFLPLKYMQSEARNM